MCMCRSRQVLTGPPQSWLPLTKPICYSSHNFARACQACFTCGEEQTLCLCGDRYWPSVCQVCERPYHASPWVWEHCSPRVHHHHHHPTTVNVIYKFNSTHSCIASCSQICICRSVQVITGPPLNWLPLTVSICYSSHNLARACQVCFTCAEEQILCLCRERYWSSVYQACESPCHRLGSGSNVPPQAHHHPYHHTTVKQSASVQLSVTPEISF